MTVRYTCNDRLEHLAAGFKRDRDQKTDFVIVCGDRDFRLHSILLTAKCGRFAREIVGEPTKNSVRLPERFVEGVKHLVEYLYLGQVDVPECDVEAFDALADYVQLVGLVGDRSAGNRRPPDEERSMDVSSLIASDASDIERDRSRKEVYISKYIIKQKRNRSGARHSYLCCLCSFETLRVQNARRHERTHTGEKPFSCRYCGKSFTQNPMQKEHEAFICKQRPRSE